MKRTTATLLVLALAAVLAESAGASRAPTASERVALAQAMQTPRRCLRMRVATVRPGWAFASFKSRATDSCLPYASDGVTVFRRRDDVWRRRFAGSSWSCPMPRVPEVVRQDLGLPCPEGGG